MSLLAKIKDDLMSARYAKNQTLVTILTTLYSEAASVGKTKRNGASTDAEVLLVIKKFKEGVEQLLPHTPVLNWDALNTELEVYISYLPKMLTDEELAVVISSYINTRKAENQPTGIQYVMAYLKEQYVGRYDGKTASNLIKSMV